MLHLTGRSYVLTIIIVIIAIVGQWSENTAADLWSLPAAMIICLLLVEWLSNKKDSTQIHRITPIHPVLGKAFHVQLRAENTNPHTLHLLAKQSLPESLIGESPVFSFDLATGENKVFELLLVPQSLGKIEWTPIYIRIKGLFGLAWWEREIIRPDEIKVVPDHLNHKEHCSGLNESGERNSREKGSGFELLGLRDYLPGDPLRTVDWKATARTGKRTVRLLTQEQHLELLILIDCGRYSSYQAGNLSRLHHACNIAARISEKALYNGDCVGLVTFAEKPCARIAPNSNKSNLTHLRKVLTTTRSMPVEPNILLAVYESLKLLSHRALILILTDLERKDHDGQLLKAISLLRPKHLPIIASPISEELMEMKNTQTRNWLAPYESLAASEGLHTIENNLAFLKRFGAKPVATLPSRLDQAVFHCYQQTRSKGHV